jgi:hypothetical protein
VDNLGDPSTPANSLGSQYPGWRYIGTRKLPGYSLSPDDYSVLFSDDVGAQGGVVAISSLFGLQYHGLGDGGSASNALDLDGSPASFTEASSGSLYTMSVDETAVWAGAQTADLTLETAFNDDGSVSTTLDLATDASATNVYIGMTIATAEDGSDFSEGRILLGEAERAFPIYPGRTFLGPETGDITLRSPDDGREVRRVSNADEKSGFKESWIARTAQRSKLYDQVNNGVISVSDVTKTVSFDVTAAGATSFGNLVTNGDFSDGLTNVNRTGIAGNTSVVSGQLRMVKHATSDVRANMPFACTIGKRYMAIEQGVQLAGGLELYVGLNVNGTLTGALRREFFQAAEDYIAVVFTATQTEHVLAVNLPSATSSGTAGDIALLDNFQVIQLD